MLVNHLETTFPGAPLTNFNDGEVRQRFIFYTQKNHNFRICLPQKITTSFVLFSQPKKSVCFFLATPKIPLSFIDPKKSLWAKISDPKKSLGPPVIKICEWRPWDHIKRCFRVKLSPVRIHMSYCTRVHAFFFYNNFIRTTKLKFAQKLRTSKERLRLGFRCKCNYKFLLKSTLRLFTAGLFAVRNTVSEKSRRRKLCRTRFMTVQKCIYTAVINLCCRNKINFITMFSNMFILVFSVIDDMRGTRIIY